MCACVCTGVTLCSGRAGVTVQHGGGRFCVVLKCERPLLGRGDCSDPVGQEMFQRSGIKELPKWLSLLWRWGRPGATDRCGNASHWLCGPGGLCSLVHCVSWTLTSVLNIFLGSVGQIKFSNCLCVALWYPAMWFNTVSWASGSPLESFWSHC